MGINGRLPLTLWFSEDGIDKWLKPETGKKKRGGQRKYSDECIILIFTLRQIYHLPLRQAEGFVRSIIKDIFKIKVDVPDYSTISRRFADLNLRMKEKSTDQSKENLVISLDSTGLKVSGEKEWMNYKHGTKLRRMPYMA